VRIGLFYNRDIYAHAALNQLIPKLSDHELGMFYSQRVGSASQTRDPRLVALAQVETHFATAPGLSFEAMASKSHCREIAITDINGRDLNLLRAFDADLLISIRFGQIFKAEAIAQPRTGIINLHSGLLPEYKGVMASFWSLLNEEPRLGTTLHWITDKKIDSGALISTRSQPARSSETYVKQVLSLYRPGAEQICEAVHQLQSLASTKGDDLPSGAYYSFPTTDDIDRFEKRGWRLFEDPIQKSP
jgi:methionyl-tRNA formyltransferase